MKSLLLLLLIAYLLAMWWLRQREKPGPSFRPWYVRLKPRQKK